MNMPVAGQWRWCASESSGLTRAAHEFRLRLEPLVGLAPARAGLKSRVLGLLCINGRNGHWSRDCADTSGLSNRCADYLTARLARFKVQDRLKLAVTQQQLVLTLDAPALQVAAQLDGCYVVETDLQPVPADAQTIHDRYKDRAFVEWNFRTLKTGHLEFRPWFVGTADSTQAQALTALLA